MPDSGGNSTGTGIMTFYNSGNTSVVKKSRFRSTVIKPIGLALLLTAASFGSAHAQATETKLTPSNSLAGNYLAARIASTDRDTENAVAFYRRAMQADPDNAGLKLKAFLNFVANGDFAEGIAIGKSISGDKQAPEIVSLILSVEDIRTRAFKLGERKLDREWRTALDRLLAGLVRGWTQFGQKNVKQALATVDALKGPAWFDLFVQYHGGLIALNSGDAKGAVRRLETALANTAGGRAANETYIRIYPALAHAYWKAGEKDRAKQTIANGLQDVPQNPVFEQAAKLMSEDKSPVLSIKSAQRGAAEVFLNLGTAINKEGGQQFARIYLQMAKTLAGSDDIVNLELAQLYDGENLLARANTLFETVAPTSPYYRISQLERALNLDELGDKEAARKVMDTLVESGPDDLVTHLSYGAVLARHEDYNGAIGVFEKIVARLPKPDRRHWNLFYRLGIAYERTKQWPKAEASFRTALKLYPDQPSVLNYLGYSWIDMNINLQEGLDMIRKAVDERPNDGYIVDSLGWAFYRLGRYQEAVVELERAVELRPGDPTINDHLGDAYWKAKRKLEATFQWQHALSLEPPKGDDKRIKDKLEKGLDEVEKLETAKGDQPDKG